METSMTDKHTPGPWQAKERTTEPDNHGKYSIYNSAENEYIASCDAYLNGHHDTGKNQANARLIAAAPELLEALEEWSAPYIDYYVGFTESGITERLERTRAAIKAAKGDA